MGRCAQCGKIIIGGKRQGKLRFCNDRCYEKGFLTAVAEAAAPELITARVASIHQQDCPVCGGEGPVDICTSHTAWSAVYFTSWKDYPRLSCSRCGKRAIWRGLMFTFVCGWWGFPFGVVATPWQLINGIKSLGKLPRRDSPSEELQYRIKIQIAEEIKASSSSVTT